MYEPNRPNSNNYMLRFFRKFLPTRNVSAVRTSIGIIGLTACELGILGKLLSGNAPASEALQFYQSVSSRGIGFPAEWERIVLRSTVAQYPDRRDLVERLAIVEASLHDRDRVIDTAADVLQWENAWQRFTRTPLIGHSSPESAAAARETCFSDACTLLSSPHFAALPIAKRHATIIALHNTLMSAPSPDLVPVADLGLRQFRRMLADPSLTNAQAMGVYDALHSLYFSGVTDVLDLRRFDAIAQAFESWLLKRHVPLPKTLPATGGTLRIAYLLHTGHDHRGNAVTPLIVSLAAAHTARPDREVFLYLVQYVDPDFAERISNRPFVVRSFPQNDRYDRLDEVAAAMREDHIDVVITEQNRAIATALFAQRVAPLQIWADTGFPFWSLRSLDWTLAPAASDPPDTTARKSRLTWRQEAATLKQRADPSKVSAARNQFPADAFILGVFVRLIKLNPEFLRLLGELLAAEPTFRLIIAGTGDATAVQAFAADPLHVDRVLFLHENVDLNVYAQVIDVMCDTFPFIGGNACRQVMAHGTPVVSMLGTAWDTFLHEDRSPDLLAKDHRDYVDTIRRLHQNHDFLVAQREISNQLYAKQTDPKKMIEDVESAIFFASVKSRYQ